MYRKVFAVIALLLAFTALVSAQDITPRPDDEIASNANVVWPPPVYVLRGEIDIVGSASIADMTSYFIEFRPLTLPEPEVDGADTVDEDATDTTVEDPWFPATLPDTNPVQDDVLGTWNTETAPDGLYEMRLVINVSGQQPMYFYVSPLRIENEPSEFVDLDVIVNDSPLPTATRPVVAPTLQATPTELDRTPRVVATLNANVRSGPGLGYEVIDTLLEGQVARVVGVSSSGNGWYFIDLPDSSRGWIAPSVVDASGDLGTVPRIDPPATPTPIATNTPPPAGNLTGSPPSLTPNPPTCNVQFEVLANITNTGTTTTSSPVSVLIQDVHVATGQVQSSITREVPALSPGQNWVVGGPLTISTFFNEEHRIEVIIDTGGQVAETNETDNVLSTTYILQQGGC